MSSNEFPAILEHKNLSQASVFKPENLLREARRQKGLDNCPVPTICVLDPDGDLVNYLIQKEKAVKSRCWACYHSHLYVFTLNGIELGIIPVIVGAPYAVLVAEQLFVSGCEYLISITSSGIINPPRVNKRFALITESVRDEGTSYHYLPKESPARISNDLCQLLLNLEEDTPWFPAKSWTTDAPYRETELAIEAMKKIDVTCVEMEAAALYAFAEARDRKVICFANLTNTMAQEEGDFEKGEHFGSLDSLSLIRKVLVCLSI